MEAKKVSDPENIEKVKVKEDKNSFSRKKKKLSTM